MGCSASQSAVAAADDTNTDPEERRPVPPPTSFEIPLEDLLPESEVGGDGEDSLIKKHPPLPKRLEERLTKQLWPPPTITDLADKLASAELRRNSILRERVNNIRNNLKREGVEGEDYIVEEQDEGVGENEPQPTEDELHDADPDDSHDKSQKNANE